MQHIASDNSYYVNFVSEIRANDNLIEDKVRKKISENVVLDTFQR